MIRRRGRGMAAGLLAAVLALAACTSTPSPSPSRGTTVPSAGTETPAASATPARIALPMPAPPYDADEILAAMRDSRRPGGVPDEIETSGVAAGIAETVVTLGGERWDALSIGASCGPEWCTVDVAGTRDGQDGADAWILAVTPAGEVEVVESDLHLLPAGLEAVLDRAAREGEATEALEDLVLASIRWLPPGEDARFVLAYRAGDEEGSCERDVLLDSEGDLVRVDSRAC